MIKMQYTDKTGYTLRLGFTAYPGFWSVYLRPEKRKTYRYIGQVKAIEGETNPQLFWRAFEEVIVNPVLARRNAS